MLQLTIVRRWNLRYFGAVICRRNPNWCYYRKARHCNLNTHKLLSCCSLCFDSQVGTCGKLLSLWCCYRWASPPANSLRLIGAKDHGASPHGTSIGALHHCRLRMPLLWTRSWDCASSTCACLCSSAAQQRKGSCSCSCWRLHGERYELAATTQQERRRQGCCHCLAFHGGTVKRAFGVQGASLIAALADSHMLQRAVLTAGGWSTCSQAAARSGSTGRLW